MNATPTNPTLSARVAAGVTAEYVRDLSRRSASAPGGGRRLRSDERTPRHRAGGPLRHRAHRVRTEPRAPRRPGVAAGAR